MRRLSFLALFGVLLAGQTSVQARGLLIPVEKTLPPLAMLDHKVSISIEDQVATTRVEQTFRNHTSRVLEATYVFPVPRGASVNRFTMWVDGKEVKGELIEAKKARQIYNSIVQRTKDPGLLEYIGTNLLRMKVFPVPARGDQKVAITFTSVAGRDANLIEYTYPLKTDGKAISTLEKFAINATVKSQHGVTNIYSPTHTIDVARVNDKEVKVSFDKAQGLLDRDFKMYYSTGKDDIGLTAILHRPVRDDKGFFTLLVSPKTSAADRLRVPRDIVLVLDTSGSMRGIKIEQARRALRYFLSQMTERDRFGLITFATSVNPYEDKLVPATADQLNRARRWVDDIEAVGGTAIDDALQTALKMRTDDTSRSFQIVFFTDGLPTIGEMDTGKITAKALARRSHNTRIFTFGVGNDVNAVMLDRIAEETRALSTYVRPEEDIEAKVSGMYSKIAHPVLTDLRVTTTGDVRLTDSYPTKLPDLFHNGQLTVMGRFTGKGPSAIKLTGKVGKETREFVYELTFPERTDESKEFVEGLWARRKVGFLLDQIRTNGEKKELVDEVMKLARRYGITTPYTSWLIVPDAPTPLASAVPGPGGFGGAGGRPGTPGRFTGPPPGLVRPKVGKGKKGGGGPSSAPPAPVPVLEYARLPGDLKGRRDADVKSELDKAGKKGDVLARENLERRKALMSALDRFRAADKRGAAEGKLGVDLALETNNLRNQAQMELRTAQRNVQGRNVIDVGGVWIDDGFNAKTKAVVLKAQSNAYFRMLDRHERVVRDVFKMGNHLVWITPSGTALVVDASNGKETMTDKEIDALFVAARR